MRIVTCIKYVPETVKKSDLSPTIERNSAPGKINPLDLNAIEEAIRIKEKNHAHTTGICMGVENAEDYVKYAVAMGLDEVVLLTDPVFAGSDTFVTSYILSKAICKLGLPDIVFCGNQSTDGSTGQIPQELAVQLGLPCIINVVSLQLVSEEKVHCTVATENGYCYVDVVLPAVIGVLKEINEPRVPSISGVLKAQKTAVIKLNSNDIMIDPQLCGLSASCTQIKTVSLYKPKNKHAKNITDSYIETIDEIVSSTQALGSIKQALPKSRKALLGDVGFVYKELWVICEKYGERLSETAFQLLSKALSIAPASHKVCAVLLDQASSEIINSLYEFGVDRVYRTKKKIANSVFEEQQLAVLISSCKKYHPTIVLFENSTQGRWLSATAAASLQTGLTADCVDLRFDKHSENLVQTRVAFSGNIIADIVCPKKCPQMATVRNNVFEAIAFSKSPFFDTAFLEDTEIIEKRIFPVEIGSMQLLSSGLRKSDIVVCGGRGLGGKKGFEKLKQLASLIGASVGATRAAVDAKWIGYGHQIGQTGITIKPKVYMAFGVSGAIEHTIGMDRAEIIISVNTDITAPINKISDYYIQDDCMKVMNSLINHFETSGKEG